MSRYNLLNVGNVENCYFCCKLFLVCYIIVMNELTLENTEKHKDYDYYVKRRTEDEFCKKFLTDDIRNYERSAQWDEICQSITEVYPKRDINDADHQDYYDQGVIPKKDLKYGEAYAGTCRNASIAVWDGHQFWYWRTKVGSPYTENINVIEDDNGYDLFLPMRQISREEIAAYTNGVK